MRPRLPVGRPRSGHPTPEGEVRGRGGGGDNTAIQAHGVLLQVERGCDIEKFYNSLTF